MNEFAAIFIIIFAVFGISFALINIRHIFTGNEFRGSCATNNPMVKDEFGNCTVCGKTAEEVCKNPNDGPSKSNQSSFPVIES